MPPTNQKYQIQIQKNSHRLTTLPLTQTAVFSRDPDEVSPPRGDVDHDVEDEEVVEMIKELIDVKVRPMVQEASGFFVSLLVYLFVCLLLFAIVCYCFCW